MTTLRRIVPLALLMLLATACEMRTWLDIDLSDPANGQVVVTFGFDDQLRELFEESLGAGDIFEEIESEAGEEGWMVAPFLDDDVEGVTVTRTFASIEELNEIMAEAPSMGSELGEEGGTMVEGVSIVDTGDTIRFEGSIPSAAGEEIVGRDLDEALSVIDFDARVSVTFPGDVVEHNGELVGRTVTWRFFEDNLDGVEMFAEARNGGGVSAPVIGGVALALLLAGVVVYRLRSGGTRETVSEVRLAHVGVSESHPAAAPDVEPTE